MLRTKTDLTIEWRPSSMSPDFPAHRVFVPAGTRVLDLGKGKLVVDDISALRLTGFEVHDATHYGIPVDPDKVERV